MRTAAAILLLAASLQAQVQPDTLPPQLRDAGMDQKLDAQAPLDLDFRDEAGRAVKLSQYFGKRPVVLSLVYYDCPMLCNLVLNGEVRTLRTLTFDAGKEFEALTISFDPREKPDLAMQKKESYIEKYRRAGAEGGWHFLTGNEDSIRRLTHAVGFRYSYDPKSGQFAHASGLIVLTPQGKVSKYFYGVEFSGRDLRLGLVDAASGKIGTVADQVLLFCFHYDPLTGKYGPAVFLAVRFLGLLTMLSLATYMIFMLRQDANQAKKRSLGLGVRI